jgi:hypothetical protein
MVTLVSRSGWNARPPKSVVRLDWSRVVYFVVHYSGASRDQSVRSIQNYCMDIKRHADIDYNEIIRDGTVYAGRMDAVGGHALNINSQSYGVCIIGVDGDANESDLAALQERYRYACDRAGRLLEVVGHREAPHQNPTSCPGSEILGWIHSGLIDDTPPDPTPGDWTGELIMSLPTVRLGHHAPKTVRTVQAFMNRDAGADEATLLVEDGVWGPKTDARVRGWQVRHAVPNSVRNDGTGDGAFGRQCWTFALNLD